MLPSAELYHIAMAFILLWTLKARGKDNRIDGGLLIFSLKFKF